MTGRRPVSKELRPVRLSHEQEVLRRFFPEGIGKLEGKLEPGTLGRDAPEVREDGGFKVKWIMEGVFCVLDWDVFLYEGTERTGRSQGHCVLGYDAQAGEYRMLRAANLGVMHQLRGRLGKNRIVFTSGVNRIKGRQTRVRYTFSRGGPNTTIWQAEFSVGDGPWRPVGKDTLTYE